MNLFSSLYFNCYHFLLSFPAQNWDIAILKKINLGRCRQLDGIFWWITNLNFYVVYSVPLIILIIGFVRKKLILKLKGVYILSALLLSASIDNILKVTVNRPRPFTTYHFIEKLTSGGGGSFPSGHTGDAFTLATAVSLVIPGKLMKLACFIWAFTIAYSRMDLGVHYPTDVLTGAVLGILCAFLMYWIFKNKSTEFKNVTIRNIS
jgi:membrane-associated phospholipid phosphatase